MGSIEQFSNFVWEELDYPATPNIQSISGWCVGNIGKLNILLNTNFYTDSGLFLPEYNPESPCYPYFGQQEQGILQEMYMIRLYDKAIRAGLDGANWVQANQSGDIAWTTLQEGDQVIKRSDPTQLLAQYRQFKNEAQERLNNLVRQYRYDRISPGQVTGDDDI